MARRRAHGGRGESEYRRQARSVLGAWSYYTGAGRRLEDIRATGLDEVREIVARLRAARASADPVLMCWRWAWRCQALAEDGTAVGRSVRIEVETDSETNYQKSAYAAHKQLREHSPSESAREGDRRPIARYRCGRIGRPLYVPCA